ncbi:Do family serine endopeptidase [Falsiporphyromonas endometrii]|uniref:Do family serine endopeptidase n=1 Tax=Falsiporphyromonas endometrii TaxID=1387297 RepID=A0ABV9K9Z2_9PORP
MTTKNCWKLAAACAVAFTLGYRPIYAGNQHLSVGYAMTSVDLGGPDLTSAAESSVHAVVHIKVEGTQEVTQSQFMDPFEFFFGGSEGPQRRQMRPVVGYGSGVIISPDGYIVTNNHVIDNANKITVTLNDNRTFSAKLIGADPGSDIALIKIDAKNLPTIPFGDSDKLKLGEWVLAVGNPFNLTSTVTAGIVSAKARSTSSPKPGKMQVESFIQTDAAVNPGNSGGALVNSKGELVGINTMIFSQTGNYAGYSFAVPISIASKVVEDLKKYGTVQRAVMGITIGDINEDLTKKYDLKLHEGAVVTGFADVSSALAGGIKEGDVITSINGKDIKNIASLQEQVNRYRPGDKIKVTVNRKGSTLVKNVILKNLQGGTSFVKSQGINELGASFESIPDDIKMSYGISFGVIVKSVTKGKFMDANIKSGLVILSLNDQPVSSPEDVSRVVNRVNSNSSKDEKNLIVKGFYPPNGNVKFFVVNLGDKPRR